MKEYLSQNIRVISQADFHTHPLLARLLELHTIPKEIYIIGDLPDITIDIYGRATPRILTIVGSRKHTSYGKDVVEKLIASLIGSDVIILSGLAYGIDSLAHASALKNKLTTVAIPGSGLDPSVIYPRTHKRLASDIIHSGGALISELPPLSKPAPWTFVSRNRIMATLSDALLIIEAEEKSGTLVTARLALELGRDIGAVPGNIMSSTSLGTNTLIRDGAYSIASRDDLYDLLHLSQEENIFIETKELICTPNETILMNILTEAMDRDILLQKSRMQLSTFLITLSSLEMKGYIEESFGEVRRIV